MFRRVSIGFALQQETRCGPRVTMCAECSLPGSARGERGQGRRVLDAGVAARLVVAVAAGAASSLVGAVGVVADRGVGVSGARERLRDAVKAALDPRAGGGSGAWYEAQVDAIVAAVESSRDDLCALLDVVEKERFTNTEEALARTWRECESARAERMEARDERDLWKGRYEDAVALLRKAMPLIAFGQQWGPKTHAEIHAFLARAPGDQT